MNKCNQITKFIHPVLKLNVHLYSFMQYPNNLAEGIEKKNRTLIGIVSGNPFVVYGVKVKKSFLVSKEKNRKKVKKLCSRKLFGCSQAIITFLFFLTDVCLRNARRLNMY